MSGIQEIQKTVARLAAKYGAQRVWLFGSCARGEMDPTSDIDLRIDKGAIRGLELAGLLVELEDALGFPVDLIPTSSLDQNFLASIQKEEVLLYEAAGI
ncbi:MAG: nucleotidyltransferase [Angelakisella sp.]|jgi:predicted nucleotidyltransferase|nr:nucleotidyltransferase [Angelakisella sp.]